MSYSYAVFTYMLIYIFQRKQQHKLFFSTILIFKFYSHKKFELRLVGGGYLQRAFVLRTINSKYIEVHKNLPNLISTTISNVTDGSSNAMNTDDERNALLIILIIVVLVLAVFLTYLKWLFFDSKKTFFFFNM